MQCCDNIQLKILAYQADIATNSANIYKLMNQSASFGVPSGITPMTNYQYQAERNTERSMVVQQGNTTMVVRFDNVYVGNQSEVQSKIVNPIAERITEINRQVSASLYSQIPRVSLNRGSNF